MRENIAHRVSERNNEVLKGKMSGLSKEQKTAKRLANKRPTHHDLRDSARNRTFWNSRNGTFRRLSERAYRGKSERRQVIKRKRIDMVRGVPSSLYYDESCEACRPLKQAV
jgi:hypothetical protein